MSNTILALWPLYQLTEACRLDLGELTERFANKKQENYNFEVFFMRKLNMYVFVTYNLLNIFIVRHSILKELYFISFLYSYLLHFKSYY